METNDLTGIERQLVLQYLMDGNVPVTVTEYTEVVPGSPKKSLTSGVFPVALRGESMQILEQGIILLQNPPESVKAFDGKTVKVQFYFNKLGLYFITSIKSVKSGGLALVVPASIKKIEENLKNKSGVFTAILFHEKNGAIQLKCGFLESYPLFTNPAWSDVEEENQIEAKKYLENAVMHCRSSGKAVGNGLQLISVSRYLSEKHYDNQDNLEGRFSPPDIIFIDSQKIVFACRRQNMIFEENLEYDMVFSFPIKNGPIKERKLNVTITVDNVFFDEKKERCCTICSFSKIKEEDIRYLEDKRLD